MYTLCRQGGFLECKFCNTLIGKALMKVIAHASNFTTTALLFRIATCKAQLHYSMKTT